MPASNFDASRARLEGPDMFLRFAADGTELPLAGSGLAPSEELFVVERGGERRAFSIRRMAHPHVAQGTLGGEPYLLVFCAICQSAVGMTPRVDGEVRHFSAGGLYDGVVLIVDDETGSYWDQMSGRCVHGPSEGKAIEVWPVEYTTVETALARDAQLQVSLRTPTNLFDRIMRFLNRRVRGSKGFFPPGFKKTMGPVDSRLPELTQGLGVSGSGRARFYPVSALSEARTAEWAGGTLRVFVDDDGMPKASYVGDGPAPLALMSRWYGFSAAFPDCELAV